MEKYSFVELKKKSNPDQVIGKLMLFCIRGTLLRGSWDAEEMLQQLSELTTLAEECIVAPSSHITGRVMPSCVTPVLGDCMPLALASNYT